MDGYELINFERMKTEIAEAKDIETLQNMSDKLEAMRILAKQSKQSLEVQNKIAEYRLRVERKKGQWLDENIKVGVNQWVSNDTTPSIKLDDLGITRDESSRAQKIAALKEDDFEQYINETKETNAEITLNGAVKLAKEIIRNDKINTQIQELNKNLPDMPEGVFDVIVIDPPWKYVGDYDPDGHRGTCPYPLLSQEELLNFKLPSADNCILFLWTTNHFLWDAKELLDAWGFAYKNIITWDKVNMGVGYWFRNVTEHCLVGIKGSPVWTNKTFTTLLREKRTEHSKKPEAFYNMVDKICYGRKIEIFSRQKRDGWDVYGDEIKEEMEVI